VRNELVSIAINPLHSIRLLSEKPILITTLPALLAFLPFSLDIGAGAQMQQPLAITVVAGFFVSSMILFFGLPLIY
jgi:multidrug efflux pump subunit AcrB